ncbi:homocysteine S-methyltransferase family protein [Collinsella sp. zg1085]|nr:homocysteine S-methyltransferase family protein [Collinsella sp. zg1085]
MYRPRTLDTLVYADAELRLVLEGKRHLLFDGGMGTMLQEAGLAAGALPELLNLEQPDVVTRIHRAYVEAGSEVITTNTFGANALKLAHGTTEVSVSSVIQAAVVCARAASPRYVALDMGPIGSLLRPLGTLSFDEAHDLFAEQVQAGVAAGVDLVVIETMTDLAEIKAAVLAVKENSQLPICATMTFEADGRTFLGTSPEIAAVTLDALGVDVVGINCSLGPAELRLLAQRMMAVSAKPIMVQANAGLPHADCGHAVYDIQPEEYAEAVAGMINGGVGVVGGCCGTTPAYIQALAGLLQGHTPSPRTLAPALTVTSAQAMVRLPQGKHQIAVIGERINPTGKKRLQKALRSGMLDYVVEQGISQQEQGADILDVNVGLPDVDEARMLPQVAEAIAAATTTPLQIDSTDPVALEAAVRRYAGIPIINSVSGKEHVMNEVFPLVAHYGCCVVGLALDDAGIPDTAKGRVAVAQRIIDGAEQWGIGRERLLIDCLVMTASTNQEQVGDILQAVRSCKDELGVKTALGVSNVSFGLPARELLNATFLAAAFGAGLDAPILNPGSARYMDTVRAYRVLNTEDKGSGAYIERYAAWGDPYKVPVDGTGVSVTPSSTDAAKSAQDTNSLEAGNENPEGSIRHAVITGRRAEVVAATEALLQVQDAMDVINEHLIPALDEVGQRFDRGEFFLPQLMASAEAARAGFDTIKRLMPAQQLAEKGALALATVHGDIHDIGKNIVKMLLENYGYTVYDLGRDVPPERVLEAVQEHKLKLVGLSALMTTTVGAMKTTIELLHEHAPEVKTMVGGAVLTPEFAKEIGADFYAKDAAESARIAETVFGGQAD